MAEHIEEKAHALLSPSGAHRWAACPGSVVLEAPFEDKGSVYADWGTVCHEVADLVLQDAVTISGNLQPQWCPPDAEGFVGRVFTVGDKPYTFDMEMADCVNDYIAHVESFWAPGDILLPETQVPLDHITGETGATGTSDCVILRPSTGEITVIDLKTGRGEQVDAEENQQGLMYASGSAREHELMYGPFERVRIVIIQPRLNSVSEWALDWADFEERIEDISAAAALVSTAGPEDLNPGEKQCRWCKAARNAACPALDSAVSDVISSTAPVARADEFPDLTLAKQAAASDPSSADTDTLAAAWRAVPMVEKWIEGVRNRVHELLHDGVEVGTGDKQLVLYEGKRGHRRWSDPAAVEERMKKSRVKADDMYSKSLISPTQAEKGAPAENKSLWADLATMIEQPEGKPVVGVVGDPKRKVWSPAAPEDFPDLGAEEDDLFA